MSTTPPYGSPSRFYFDEGELAFEDEKPMDECPYPFDSAAGMHWCAGWESAQWQDTLAFEGLQEDRRLDDPRHEGER